MKKNIICIAFISSVTFYIMSYCCIYTAVGMFEILQPFEPEYRCKDMIGTEYMHAYVHVNGINLFLNPFTKYSDNYRTYKTSNDIINVAPNWGSLYNPICDNFMTFHHTNK
jgi:hypothetical protein